jgi:hypothetical protein
LYIRGWWLRVMYYQSWCTARVIIRPPAPISQVLQTMQPKGKQQVER